MATIKLTLDKRRKLGDGRSPLILRLTHKSNSTSIQTGIKLHFSEWDSKKLRVLKKHSIQKELNLQLKDIILRYEQKLRIAEIEKPYCNVVDLKKLITSNSFGESVEFNSFSSEQVEMLKKQGRFGNAQSYITATNSLIKYGGKNLELGEIDYNFILGFENHLSSNGIKINARAAYMRAIRALLNKGGKMGCYNMSNYPFNNFKIRTQKTASRAETIETIIDLRNIELEIGSEIHNARNIFFLIFGLIGISFMDLILLKKSNIKNGRIMYKRRKTGKLYSIKVMPLVSDILSLYTNETSDFLLPQFDLDGIDESQVRHKTNLGLKITNRYLKQLGMQLGLTSSLTTYVARYSWANIAKRKGFSKDLIAEALGHNYGNAVTGIYLEGYGNEIIDSANDKILSPLDLNSL
ncbi:MAG: hypothetical protein COB01_06360 [Lutibacter sp.]|nr:MAG: hypothetical protein COB01_06360 [Lutibacter sp.]